MSEIFNGVMRAVNTLIGLVMVAGGCVWMLQGLNLAFKVGFMVGRKEWVLYGALFALVGVAEVIWTNSRAQYYRGK